MLSLLISLWPKRVIRHTPERERSHRCDASRRFIAEQPGLLRPHADETVDERFCVEFPV